MKEGIKKINEKGVNDNIRMYILWNIKVLIFVHFYFPFFVHSYIIINNIVPVNIKYHDEYCKKIKKILENEDIEQNMMMVVKV